MIPNRPRCRARLPLQLPSGCLRRERRTVGGLRRNSPGPSKNAPPWRCRFNDASTIRSSRGRSRRSGPGRGDFRAAPLETGRRSNVFLVGSSGAQSGRRPRNYCCGGIDSWFDELWKRGRGGGRSTGGKDCGVTFWKSWVSYGGAGVITQACAMVLGNLSNVQIKGHSVGYLSPVCARTPDSLLCKQKSSKSIDTSSVPSLHNAPVRSVQGRFLGGALVKATASGNGSTGSDNNLGLTLV